MSVEATEVTSEVWTRWQGHVINGMFPLGRYLGCSDHSGVFLTRSAARPADVAIKLVPTNRALAEVQLPRWKRAGALSHPHLLRLLEWGGCQLDGLPYLYTVMEYADQTLAQLLLHRALTEEEAQEMLLPALDALAFLHARNLVQGQLKPANILVVGDQLKLASDTIRRVTEGGSNTATVYDPPESRHGGTTTAGDMWALGVTLFEALTRRTPAGLGDSRDAAELPAEFSAAFRDIVARCLRVSPQDRPSVTELLASLRQHSAAAAPAPTTETTAHPAPEPMAPEPASSAAAPPPAAPKAASPAPSGAPSLKPQALLRWILAALIILVLGWGAVRVFKAHHAPAAPLPEAPGESLSQTPGGVAPAVADVMAPVPSTSTRKPGRSEASTPPAALHEEIPDVPRGARRTIRGHINVWVRVIVDQDGSVLAAVADRSGPSRYFQRLAVDAAKKWTFPPADAPATRVMQVRFYFTRDGTTGRAVTVG